MECEGKFSLLELQRATEHCRKKQFSCRIPLHCIEKATESYSILQRDLIAERAYNSEVEGIYLGRSKSVRIVTDENSPGQRVFSTFYSLVR